MKNLDQIRAKNALRCQTDAGREVVGKDDGGVVKKLPPLILNHGLLATMAFAYGDNNKGWRVLFDHIARHLADADVAIVPKDKTSHTALMEFLTGDTATSETLKLATAETMAWLSYARRFIKKDGNG
jgi:CRISPR/Cas system CMR-associated protein Cmr5 small subunit